MLIYRPFYSNCFFPSIIGAHTFHNATLQESEKKALRTAAKQLELAASVQVSGCSSSFVHHKEGMQAGSMGRRKRKGCQEAYGLRGSTDVRFLDVTVMTFWTLQL